MKRNFICYVLLVAVCASLLTGCEALDKLKQIDVPDLPVVTESPEPVPENTAEETAAEDTAPEIPRQDIAEASISTSVTVKISNVVNDAFAYDAPDRTILSFSYDHPVVIIESNPEAAEKINTVLREMEEEYYTGEAYNGIVGMGYNALLELAEENYYRYKTESAGTDIGFISSRKISVERSDDSILSFIFRDYVYTGDGTGSFYDEAYSFDINSGDILTAEQFCRSTDEFAARLESLKIDSGLSGDGIYTCFGKDKFIIVSNNESGTEPEYAYIDYADIADCLSFEITVPVSGADVSFSIVEESFTGNDIAVTDKVTVDEGADSIFLYINGYASNIRLSTGYFSGSFYETQLNWYCSRAENEIVQICCSIPDGLPVLCLSYYDSAMNETQLFFSKDQNEGNPIIVSSDTVISLG